MPLRPRNYSCVVAVIAAGLCPSTPSGNPASTPQPTAAQVKAYCRFSQAVTHTRRERLGVFAPDSAISNGPLVDCALGQMAHDHLSIIRDDMQWASVENKPGHFDWSFYDGIIAALVRHHIAFLPILDDPPRFRTAAAGNPHPLPGWYPPSHDADFAHFASLAVARYGPGGAFWQSNPQLPYYPVRAWQIWNEESLTAYWEPAPNVQAYVNLLKAAYGAIKTADPGATVVTGGVPWNGGNGPGYLTQMYADGARGAFDALALHDYAVTPAEVVRADGRNPPFDEPRR